MMVLKFMSYLKNASHLSFVCWQSAVALLTMVNALEMQPGMTVNSLRNGAPAPGIQNYDSFKIRLQNPCFLVKKI